MKSLFQLILRQIPSHFWFSLAMIGLSIAVVGVATKAPDVMKDELQKLGTISRQNNVMIQNHLFKFQNMYYLITLKRNAPRDFCLDRDTYEFLKEEESVQLTRFWLQSEENSYYYQDSDGTRYKIQ